MGLSFVVLDAVGIQSIGKLLYPRAIEAHVVDTTATAISLGLDGRRVVTGTQVLVLMIRVVGLADVNYILIADIEPVNREPKFRVVAGTEAEILDPPVTGPFGVVGEDQNVFHEIQAHGSAPCACGCRYRLGEGLWRKGPVVSTGDWAQFFSVLRANRAARHSVA